MYSICLIIRQYKNNIPFKQIFNELICIWYAFCCTLRQNKQKTMKKLNLLLFGTIVLLSSCNKVKDWNCTIETIGEGESFNGEGLEINFRGTKTEMKEYEDNGTRTYKILGNSYQQRTNCK